MTACTANLLVPSVSAVADVLALWGLDGWLTPPLHPVVGASVPVIGRALTLTISAGVEGPGLAPMYDVLSRDLTGRVLLLAGASTVAGAVWGEILTLAALQQGATAVLVDGWVRDTPEMAALGFPVYANGERVVGPNGRAHLTHIDGAVSVHSVVVTADDMIVVDATVVYGCRPLRRPPCSKHPGVMPPQKISWPRRSTRGNLSLAHTATRSPPSTS